MARNVLERVGARHECKQPLNALEIISAALDRICDLTEALVEAEIEVPGANDGVIMNLWNLEMWLEG